MPPDTPQQITQRGQGSPGQQQVQFQPQEHLVDTYAGAQQDSNLDGLVKGLAAFSPALNQYVNLKNSKDATSAFKAGTAQGQLEQDSAIDPATGGIKVPPMPDNLKVDPAFNSTFAAGYRNSVGAKIGNQVQNDILTQYAENKNKDGFDPEQFLHDQVAQHTAGITDPAITDQVAKSVSTTADHIRQDYSQVQFTRLKETANANLSAAADSALDPSLPADQMYARIQSQVEPLRGQMGLMTRPEMADMLLDKVTGLSQKAGGRPDLYDLFNQKDPTTGLTMMQMNPKLQSEVTRMRSRAQEEQDKRIDAGMQTDYFQRELSDTTSATLGTPPDSSDIGSRVGPHGQFHSASEAFSYFSRMQGIYDKGQEDASAINLARSGTLWATDKKTAQGAMDLIQQPYIDALTKAAQGNQSGDLSTVPEVQQALKSIFSSTGTAGRSDIANTYLKNLIDGIKNATPTKDGLPSTQFKLAATMFAGVPDQLRSLYFDEGSTALLSSYQKDRNAGVDDSTAYANAYRSSSPEAIELAKKFTSTPEFQAKVTKQVSGLTTDWYQRIPGVGRAFGGSPDNERAVSGDAQSQVRGYLQRNPNATDDQIKAYAQNYVQTNYVYDAVNKIDVKVPPNQASEQTAEAIKSFIEDKTKQYGEDAHPTLMPTRDGQYVLAAMVNGAPIHQLEQVSFDQIIQKSAGAKLLSPDERSSMAALQDKLVGKTATVQDLVDNAPLLAKAGNLKQLPSNTQTLIAGVRQSAFNSTMTNQFTIPLPPGGFSGLAGSRLTGQGSKMQQAQAATFLGQGDQAAALTATGEGLVLKATMDPNPKAGMNIGYGYNLNANTANIPEDFRKAGIPPTSIEGVKAGTVQITPEQAARLLQASLPRYAERAKQAVEVVHPGLWSIMTKGQQAALTDVSYQVGDVSQFHKAIGALARQDQQGFTDALKVTYANKDGNRVEDTRRNNLRSLMIAGSTPFMNGLKEAGRNTN